MEEKKQTYKGFSAYQDMVIQMNTDLEGVAKICEQLHLEEAQKGIVESAEHLRKNIFSVGIVGEFKRGKSTVINALLGEDILPSDIQPCSASLNRVTYDMKPRVEVLFKDKTRKEVPVNEMVSYVTKLTKEAKQISANVEEARLYYPCQYCKNGVEIIDTPGLNDDDNMTAITLSVIPQLDASIMVISPLAPFSQYEEEFLRSKLLTSDLGRVMFVINMMDLVDEDDQEKVLDYLKERIGENILGKVESTYGRESQEFVEFKKKVGDLKLYPVSSKKALKGKMKGNEKMIQESGYPDFEEALETFLTEERGAIVVQVPVNRVKNTIREIRDAIEMRFSALNMTHQEFEEKNKETVDKIKEIREKKKQELNEITKNSQKAYPMVEPQIFRFWQKVQEGMELYANSYPLPQEKMTKESLEKFQEEFREGAEKRYQVLVQQQFEPIQSQINDLLGQEILRLGEFERNIGQDLRDIASSFQVSSSGMDEKASVKGVLGGTAVEFFSMFAGVTVFGLGGIVSGYMEHGIEGALVGGATAFATGTAAGLLVSALALPVGFPLVLGVSLLASFTGKKAVNAIWPKKKNNNQITEDKLRSVMVESLVAMVNAQRDSRELENAVHQQITNGFSAIKEKIENETEKTLRDTEKTLSDIQEGFMKEAIECEQTKQWLGKLTRETADISERIMQVDKKITEVLVR